jgi:hypothetical protein
LQRIERDGNHKEKVRLEKVTQDNREHVINLGIHASQLVNPIGEQLLFGCQFEIRSRHASAWRLFREAHSWLPDRWIAENEGQGEEGSLSLSLRDQVKAPMQKLWSDGAEQQC